MFARLHRLLRRTAGAADSSADSHASSTPARAPGPVSAIPTLVDLFRPEIDAILEEATPVLDTLSDILDIEREAGPATDSGPGRADPAEATIEHRAPEAPAQTPVEAPRAPTVQSDGLDALLAREELEHQQIAQARGLIAARPVEERPALYRALAAKVSYRNQRDNAAKHGAADAKAIGSSIAGDVMCNVTSMAMALNGLGIGADESSTQLEDQLDELIVEEKLGSRYDLGGQQAAAAKMGAATERVWTPTFQGGAAAQAWFEKNVLPRLEQGDTAVLSMQWGAKGDFAHIVRLEWVGSDGLLIDDPYGKLFHNGSFYTYDGNEAASSEGQGAKGEDRVWSWDTVAGVVSGRYVQFLSKA
jgi:hypothetical protein